MRPRFICIVSIPFPNFLRLSSPRIFTIFQVFQALLVLLRPHSSRALGSSPSGAAAPALFLLELLASRLSSSFFCVALRPRFILNLFYSNPLLLVPVKCGRRAKLQMLGAVRRNNQLDGADTGFLSSRSLSAASPSTHTSCAFLLFDVLRVAASLLRVGCGRPVRRPLPYSHALARLDVATSLRACPQVHAQSCHVLISSLTSSSSPSPMALELSLLALARSLRFRAPSPGSPFSAF
jgi:hypothetical protein